MTDSLTSNPKVPEQPVAFSVELRVEIKKGRRMQYVLEVSIPVATMKDAERIRQPFHDEIIRAVRLSHRRYKRRLVQHGVVTK